MYLSPWDRREPRCSNSVQYDIYYMAEMDGLSQRYGDLALAEYAARLTCFFAWGFSSAAVIPETRPY